MYLVYPAISGHLGHVHFGGYCERCHYEYFHIHGQLFSQSSWSETKYISAAPTHHARDPESPSRPHGRLRGNSNKSLPLGRWAWFDFSLSPSFPSPVSHSPVVQGTELGTEIYWAGRTRHTHARQVGTWGWAELCSKEGLIPPRRDWPTTSSSGKAWPRTLAGDGQRPSGWIWNQHEHPKAPRRGVVRCTPLERGKLRHTKADPMCLGKTWWGH